MNLLGGFYVSKALPWSAQDACNWLPTIPVVDGVRSPLRLRAAPGIRDIVFDEGDGFGGAIVFTSPPYEYETFDRLDVFATLADGELRTLLRDYEIPVEQINVSATLVGGSLGVLLQSVSMPPETLDVSATLQAGELRTLLRTYDLWPAEQVNVNATLQAGELRQILITYDFWPSEQINVSATLQAGYLGP